jgi:hypothetical protein
MASPMQPVTAQDSVPLTKSDTTVHPKWAALRVGTGGDVAFRSAAGINRLWPDVPSGSIIPVAGDMLLSTGTDASDIDALYY